MTGFNHGLTGALIALTVKQPVLAIPLSFFSHFITDALPHWDYGTSRPGGRAGGRKFNKILLGDFLLAIILMLVLGIVLPAQRWLVWSCMVAAASPDLVWWYYHYYKTSSKKRLDPLSRFHALMQWSESSAGAYLETAWFLVLGVLILNLV